MGKDKDSTFKEEMDRWLRVIDAEFTAADLAVPSPPLPFARDQLKKIPNWRMMAELRYGRGPTPSAEQTFTIYRAALKIVAAALQEFAGMDLSRARVKLQKPPWMRPLEEVFPRRNPSPDSEA